MLNMTKEEFMKMAMEVTNEKRKEFMEGKDEPELSLLFMFFGITILKEIADRICEEEE